MPGDSDAGWVRVLSGFRLEHWSIDLGRIPMAWFVKLEEGIVSQAEFDAAIPCHLAWLQGLDRAGHQPRSGYWADRKGLNGQGAGGMLLFWAENWEQAEALIHTDPLVSQGCVRWTLHAWALVFGGLEAGVAMNGTTAPSPT